MGRRKISIQPITEERNRKVTFVKRKAGLFKKAHELAVLCQVDLAVVILSNNNSKFYEYSSVKIEDLMKNHGARGFSHDVKTPGDYGDYELISRVQKNGAKGHTKQQNSISLSVDDEDLSDEDEDEEDEDDDEDENETVPPSKKRKTIVASTKVANTTSTRSSKTVKTVQHSPNNKPIPAPYSTGNSQIPLYNNSLAGPPPIQNQQPIIFQQANNQQYQMRTRMQSNLPQGQPSDIDSLPFPDVRRGNNFGQQQQHQQQFGYNNMQFFPGTPSSQRSELLPSISTPVVANSGTSSSSPYDTSRARALNNNINKRPILRVEIPQDSPSKQADSDGKDSVATLTGGQAKDENPLSAVSAKGNSSAESNRPSLIEHSSNKSTPLSATLPSRGGFSLPPPQSSQHVQYQQNFKQLAGEQTPLTGGLPSKYVPDLFPSPSNFYSNEWNIPFGSGTTPFPNSAGPHQLPNVNPSSAGPPRLAKLPSLNADLMDSPLQYFSKEPKERKNENDNNEAASEITGKKINFKES